MYEEMETGTLLYRCWGKAKLTNHLQQAENEAVRDQVPTACLTSSLLDAFNNSLITAFSN